MLRDTPNQNFSVLPEFRARHANGVFTSRAGFGEAEYFMTTEKIYGILPQTQPTNCTCVHTCLAMCLGVPVKQVMHHFGKQEMTQAGLINALHQCNVIYDQLVFGTLIFEGWYFAGVPSFNVRGGMHQILIHRRAGNLWTVLDPSYEKCYKRDGSNLKHWTDLVPFVPGGKLPVQK